MTEKEIRNCRIIIKDAENGQTIADTKILRYNSYVNSVNIPANSILKKDISKIHAIIFAENGLYRSTGKLREEVTDDEVEILLGKSVELEERRAARYPIDFEGSITEVYIQGRKNALPGEIPVRVIDMSSGGVLLRAGSGVLQVGKVYSLVLRTEIGDLTMICEVVRIQDDDGLSGKYGCRIGNVQRVLGRES